MWRWMVGTLVLSGLAGIMLAITVCDGVKKRSTTPPLASGVCGVNPCQESNKNVCEEVAKGKSYTCICNKGYAELADESCKKAVTNLTPNDLVGTWKETKVIVISTGCALESNEKSELSSSYMEKVSSSKIKVYLCKDKECKEKYDGKEYPIENGTVEFLDSFVTDLSKEYDTACKMILDLAGTASFLDASNGYNYFQTTFRLEGEECKAVKKEYPEIDASENCVTKWKSITAKEKSL